MSRYVALKISTADMLAKDKELSLRERIAHQDSKHILTLLESFLQTGPNGTHLCLVFEPMAASFNWMLEPHEGDLPNAHLERAPLSLRKKVLRHTLLGLCTLHDSGIVHGDIQFGNVLLGVKDLDSVPEDELRQDMREEIGISWPIQRLDRKEDKWAPRYLAVPQPLAAKYIDIGPSLTAKLSDLGGGMFLPKPSTITADKLTFLKALLLPDDHHKPVTPIALRAPELVLGLPFDQGIDIWAFGWLIAQLVTGQPPFAIDNWADCTPEDEAATDDDHIMGFIDLLGPLPEHLLQMWPRRERYYQEDGTQIRWNVDSGDPGEPGPQCILEDFILQNRNPDISVEEAAVISGLLRQILQYEPEKRPSAQEILSHAWLQE